MYPSTGENVFIYVYAQQPLQTTYSGRNIEIRGTRKVYDGENES
jgi:hypothetical protein